MDFALTDEQTAIRDLAARILTDQLPPERIRDIEAGDDWFAADTWAELAKADLLGLCLPEAHGGGGYGFFELALICDQVGRTVAPLPVLATLVLGALPIAKFWAAEGAHRVVHAAQHLHGGTGVDADYPVHRTFRWTKHVELSLGGGTTHLRRLGALLAAG